MKHEGHGYYWSSLKQIWKCTFNNKYNGSLRYVHLNESHLNSQLSIINN